MREPTADNTRAEDPLLAPVAGITQVELDDQVCLYSPQGEQVLVLNETASDVWRLVDGTLSVAGVVDLLTRAYRADAHEIRKDVLDVITQLQAAGVLTIAPVR
jgi:hypothetical protein